MSIKTETKQLWQETFGDSQEFVDFYFDRIFSNRINYVVRKKGNVVAALQAIEFDFLIDEKVLKTAYLSGIATHKDYRRQGYMQKLLEKTHLSLMRKGFDAVFLIPAENYLFDIYQKFGYRTAFYKSYQKIAKINSNHTSISMEELKNVNRAFSYFHKKQLEQNRGVIFSKKYFKTILDGFCLENGVVFVAKQQGVIVGILFLSPMGVVSKIFAETDDIKNAMLLFIKDHQRKEKVIIKTNKKDIPYGMMLFFYEPCDISIHQPSVYLMMDE